MDNANFQLQGNSPAIDSGVAIAGVTSTSDIVDVTRPKGAGIDCGAYEYNLKPSLTTALNVNGSVGVSLSYRIYYYNYPISF